MQFLATSISYADAPLETLEKVAVKSDELATHVRNLTKRIGGDGAAAIVSTCNRTEFYAVTEDAGATLEEMTGYMQLLARRHSATDEHPDPEIDVSPYIRVKSGYDAVLHLCRVVTGLDALVIGDHQVAGQVTRAFRALGDTGTQVHPRLSRMFHLAFRAGRKARRESGLGYTQVSIPTFGIRLLEREVGQLSGKSALLVGAGETGRLAAIGLIRAGVDVLRIASRSSERAEGLASEVGGIALKISGINSALAEADIVVTCTSAETPVINKDDVLNSSRIRNGKELHLLDLGLPRDIEADCASIEGVALYTLDNLLELQAEHERETAEAGKVAEKIVARSAAEFMADIEALPALKALGERAEAVRTQELSRTLRRMPHLTETDRENLDAMTRSIVKQLLSDPIQQIRSTNR